MKVRVSTWQKVVDLVSRKWPRKFYLQEMGMVMPDHPWVFSTDFDEKGRFGVRVRAGYVNGSPAFVQVSFENATTKTKKRIALERERAGLPPPAKDEIVQSYLDEDPLIPLRWRPVDPEEPNTVLPPVLQVPPKKLTQIFATEIVVSTVRTYTTAVVDYTATDEGIVADVNVGYRIIDSPGFQIDSRSNFSPAKYEFSAKDIFFNRYSEPPAQEIKIMTLYGAKPKGSSMEISPEWTFGADYDTHYNLAFTENVLPSTQVFRPLTFVTPLGLGLAVAPGFLAADNQAAADALAFLSERRTGGFYHVV